MKKYILLLRGINIGVYNRIKMPQLRELFADIGMPLVTTYIQSGNVLFDHKDLDEKKVIKDLQEILQSKMGWSVPIFIYDVAEWKKIVKSNPFAKKPGHDPAFFHVTLLEKTKKDIELLEHKDESSPVIGRAVYLYCPDGYRNTKINNTTIQKKLSMLATTRNWNTMNKLLALIEEVAK
jgi:uncharacterized protein (DUF1697 family)